MFSSLFPHRVLGTGTSLELEHHFVCPAQVASAVVDVFWSREWDKVKRLDRLGKFLGLLLNWDGVSQVPKGLSTGLRGNHH